MNGGRQLALMRGAAQRILPADWNVAVSTSMEGISATSARRSRPACTAFRPRDAVQLVQDILAAACSRSGSRLDRSSSTDASTSPVLERHAPIIRAFSRSAASAPLRWWRRARDVDEEPSTLDRGSNRRGWRRTGRLARARGACGPAAARSSPPSRVNTALMPGSAFHALRQAGRCEHTSSLACRTCRWRGSSPP